MLLVSLSVAAITEVNHPVCIDCPHPTLVSSSSVNGIRPPVFNGHHRARVVRSGMLIADRTHTIRHTSHIIRSGVVITRKAGHAPQDSPPTIKVLNFVSSEAFSAARVTVNVYVLVVTKILQPSPLIVMTLTPSHQIYYGLGATGKSRQSVSRVLVRRYDDSCIDQFTSSSSVISWQSQLKGLTAGIPGVYGTKAV